MRARTILWTAAGALAGGLIAKLAVTSVIRPRKDIEVPELVPKTDRFPHKDLDDTLKEYVDKEGLVDYAGLKQDRGGLDRYAALLAKYSPGSHPDLFPTDRDKLAYWINAYNALTMTGVLAHYPVGSVTHIRPAFGFFRVIKFIVGGEVMSLDNIEHGIVRPVFQEPRVHFALNCASMSCPKLPTHAFPGARLSAELDRECRSFIAEERNVRVDPAQGKVALSMIFKWYEGDFLGWLKREKGMQKPSILDYVKVYAEKDKSAALERPGLRITYTPYDWRLNDRRTGRG